MLFKDFSSTNYIDAFTGPQLTDSVIGFSNAGQTETFTFNAAGLSFLEGKLGGTAVICVREYTNEYLDVTPTNPDRLGMYTVETGTVSRRPFLTINGWG